MSKERNAEQAQLTRAINLVYARITGEALQVAKKFLEEKDWKLIGVDAREESGAITKEGLN